MSFVNLGILAHVDAGKTSLTERLLYAAGVIDDLGRVDDGSTRTDTLALERQRGITIRSAVASFVVPGPSDDVTVNLIDTPGHPDFIAEVERVLGVLDGAVLVVSAVEGVQPQTRILMRTLARLRIPTLVFVNKIDRAGAHGDRVLRDVAARLTPAVVALGSVDRPGTRGARYVPFDPVDPERLTEVLADHDDAVMAAFVDTGTVPADVLRAALTTQTARARVHPVLFGSAITGAGVDALLAAVSRFLPRSAPPEGPVSGTVFKVERGRAGEKIAYARMFTGTLHVRDRLRFGDGREGRVTRIEVVDRGTTTLRDSVSAGRIGRLWGLGDVRIGDPIGTAPPAAAHHFAPPTLETMVVPHRGADAGAVHLALTRLAEQDPLIDLRRDPVRGETSVSLYGEVQKEVVAATLAAEFGLDVGFRESTTICVERPRGAGAAVEVMGEGNPFLATVGLRVEPAAVGSGVVFGRETELGALPPAFLRAVEETVRETLGQGLYGWPVPDATVTLTRSGYAPRQSHAHATFDKSMSSTAGDFRLLTPLVLMRALTRAGTEVHEPVHRFRLELPADTLAGVVAALSRMRAVPGPPDVRGRECVLEGEIPAGRLHGLQQQLPGLTRGEGVLESTFSGHRPVRGAVPSRTRTDHDPLDRAAYLLRVVRRV